MTATSWTETAPVNGGTSLPATFTSTADLANPFTESNCTWTEMTSSTGAAWAGFYVIWGGNVTHDHGFIHVATGASSSESRIATIPISQSAANISGEHYVAIPVASGTRLSCAVVTDNAATVYVQLSGRKSAKFTSDPSFTVLDAGPFVTDTGSGAYGRGDTLLNPTADNTKTAYSELTDNDGNNVMDGGSLDYAYALLGAHICDNFSGSSADYEHLWDIAYGAASSETVVWGDISMFQNNQEVNSGLIEPLYIPWDQAATTRMSARIQVDSNHSDTDTNCRVMLMGYRE